MGVVVSGWMGRLSAEPGRLQFVGKIGASAAHVHGAVQMLHVTQGTVVLRDNAGRERTTSRAVIPAGTVHELLVLGPHVEGTISYLDPTTPAAQDAARLLATSGDDPAAVDTWTAVAPETPPADMTLPRHPALRHALQLTPTLIAGRMLIGDVAAQVGLSPSRLGHLFAEELGLSYPVWRRWIRLQHAVVKLIDGATITDAAHSAGFTDCAHLTRCCQAMFGMAPSQLFGMAPNQLRAHIVGQ
jgi:AraC-like DNA-binding protein